MKVAFTLQYRGDQFHGFQRQNDVRTVQQSLEEAIEIVTRRRIRVYTAGRTDTGVSAQGQVVHCALPDSSYQSLDRFIYSLNSLTPEALSIIHGSPVPDDFHARFSCLGREYSYHVLLSDRQMAWFGRYAYRVRGGLDLRVMRECADILTGELDFAAFTRAMMLRKGEKTMRRIDEIRFIEQGPSLYFYYKGSGFLHNMIRIITGTLIAAGRGHIGPADVQNMLDSRDRRESGITLPPEPLAFINARYRDYATPEKLIPFYSLLRTDSLE